MRRKKIKELTSPLNILALQATILHNPTGTDENKRCIILEDQRGRCISRIDVWKKVVVWGDEERAERLLKHSEERKVNGEREKGGNK